MRPLHLHEEILLKLRSTRHASPSLPRWMRNIIPERVRYHPEHIPAIPQMLQPLHLIERVVRESLIKPRHPRDLLHHHIPSSHSLPPRSRLLRLSIETNQRSQRRRVVRVIPLLEVIVVQSLPRTERLASFLLSTRRQFRLRVRKSRFEAAWKATAALTSRCTPGTCGSDAGASGTPERSPRSSDPRRTPAGDS